MNSTQRRFFVSTAVALVALSLILALAGAIAQDSSGQSGESALQVESSDLVPKGLGREIAFTSWTGSYMRSQMLGFVRPYEAKRNTRFSVEHYAGGIDEIRDRVESANVVWDVVDLTQADSLRACQEGLLEDLSDIALPDGADGVGFREDFVEGALNDCGVGVIVWATTYAYSDSAFLDNPPSTIADFFDTETYPSPRAIRNDPRVIMEWALIADGVAVADVYGLLETPKGVEHALENERDQAGARFFPTLSGGRKIMSVWRKHSTPGSPDLYEKVPPVPSAKANPELMNSSATTICSFKQRNRALQTSVCESHML